MINHGPTLPTPPQCDAFVREHTPYNYFFDGLKHEQMLAWRIMLRAWFGLKARA